MRRYTSVVLCALVAILSGCSSSGESENTVVGIRAAAKDIVANLEAGRYKHACEDLTARARSDFAVARGGCVGALAFARGFLAVQGYPRLGQIVQTQVNAIASHVEVVGIRGLVNGKVEVLYESGRWRFEASRAAALAAEPAFRATLDEALKRLDAGGIAALVEAGRNGG